MDRISKVIRDALKEYNIPHGRILGIGNKGTPRDVIVTAARWRVIHELRNKDNPLSYPKIGKILNVDHSTVVHAARKMRETDGRYFEEKIKKICPQSLRDHKRKNRNYILSELKKEFEKGIVYLEARP